MSDFKKNIDILYGFTITPEYKMEIAFEPSKKLTLVQKCIYKIKNIHWLEIKLFLTCWAFCAWVIFMISVWGK